MLRRTSWIVLITFSSLCMQPLAAAATGTRHFERRTLVQEPYARLLTASKKLAESSALLSQVGQLRSLAAEARAQLAAELDRGEQTLRKINAPVVFWDRLAVARSKFAASSKKIEETFDQIAETRTGSAQKFEQSVLAFRKALAETDYALPLSQVDLDKLPVRAAKADSRAPLPGEAQLRALIAKKGTTGAVPALTLALGPEFLAETQEVRITPGIQALAASLGNDASRIAQWVANNIDFVPTYGAIQDSELTLKSGRGNAFDIAGLQLALLRAAGVPSRYVYGTVELSAAAVMNWVGAVDRMESAVALMSAGGVPVSVVIEGGIISRLRFEHVWVEAFVDYYPSRGTVSRTPSTWVPSDASYKRYIYSQGMDLKVNVPFDGAALMATAKGQNYREGNGWVQNLDSSAVQSALDLYQSRIDTYVSARTSMPTFEDVVGGRRIDTQQGSFLPGTLPYKIVAKAGTFPEVPDSLRYRIAFKLYASPSDKDQGSPAFVVQRSLATLAGRRISLTYQPATSGDRAVILAALANNQVSFPAYLVNTTPTLSIEDASLATANSVPIGTPQVLTVDVIGPHGTRSKDYSVVAGDVSVVGINASGISAASLSERASQHDLASGNVIDPPAESLFQVVMGWWAQKNFSNAMIARANDVVAHQLPSHALASAPVSVRSSFGIAQTASYKRRVIDGKEDLLVLIHADLNADIARHCLGAIGKIGSTLEAEIFHQAFGVPSDRSVSTTTILRAANDQGVRTYVLTPANSSSILDELDLSADVRTDVTNALAAGLRVTIPQHDIQVGQFTGIGYILEDADTGAGAYLISGGLNGGSSAAQEEVFPLPQVPLTPILGFLSSSGGAKVIVEQGVARGIALPAAEAAAGAVAGASTAAAILAAIVAVLVIVAIAIIVVETLYPRRAALRFRHYSTLTGAAGIDAQKVIIQTIGGTFDDGVYVAVAADETARGIGCPPNGLDVATRFQIPEPGKPDPARAAAWVEFELTRANLYIVDTGTNSTPQVETIFRSPLIPWVHPVTGKWTKGLYIGAFALGIDYSGACY